VLSAAAGYGLLAGGLFAWKKDLGFESHALKAGLVAFAVMTVFITRDITFIQWCRLTRMRAPVLKGVLFIGLYYAAAIVVCIVAGVHSDSRGQDAYALLTPVGAIQLINSLSLSLYFGIGIQVAVILFLEMAIAGRLRRGGEVVAG
jgi:hypothetical protein